MHIGQTIIGFALAIVLHGILWIWTPQNSDQTDDAPSMNHPPEPAPLELVAPASETEVDPASEPEQTPPPQPTAEISQQNNETPTKPAPNTIVSPPTPAADADAEVASAAAPIADDSSTAQGDETRLPLRIDWGDLKQVGGVCRQFGLRLVAMQRSGSAKPRIVADVVVEPTGRNASLQPPTQSTYSDFSPRVRALPKSLFRALIARADIDQVWALIPPAVDQTWEALGAQASAGPDQRYHRVRFERDSSGTYRLQLARGQ